MTIIFSICATFIIYALYIIVDFYFPKKTYKTATLLRKHTESYTTATIDHSGAGHERYHTRHLFTIEYLRHTQTEVVSQQQYNRAIVGQPLQLVRLERRFSHRLIGFEFILS